MEHYIAYDDHVYTNTLCLPDEPSEFNGLVIDRRISEDDIAYINAHGISRIEVSLSDPFLFYIGGNMPEQGNAADEMVDYDVDILPLANCGQLFALRLFGNIKHGEALACFPNLRYLLIDNTIGKNRVDLSLVPQLDTLVLTRPGKNVVGMGSVKGLTTLMIWNYCPKSRDLSELEGMKKLRHLRLIQPRIDNLRGIEQLDALSKLEIHYSRTLKDVSALSGCKQHVEVELSNTPNLSR